MAATPTFTTVNGLRVIENPYQNAAGVWRPYKYDVTGLPRSGDGYMAPNGTRLDSNGRVWGEYSRFADAGSGGGSGVPAGSNGLYDSAVNSPWYQQALAATRSAEAADSAARRSAIQQALIQFGIVPEGFQDKYGDVDATTRSLATANTSSGISAFARLKQALADSQRDASRRLAAKGLRRSGARGYALRKNQLGYDQNYSDAVGKLLGYTSGLYSNYANNAYQRQMGLSGALGSAITRMGDWYSTPSTGTGGLGQAYGGIAPTSSGYLFGDVDKNLWGGGSTAPYTSAGSFNRGREMGL